MTCCRSRWPRCRAQTQRADAVVVVDNASTDGTDRAAGAATHADLDVVRLTRNTGGAGGFAVGIERALTHEPDLVWLLDDDTVPDPDRGRGAGPRLAGVRRPGGRRPRCSPAGWCGPTAATTR